MKYNKIREEELKNKIGQEFFKNFDTTQIIGNIDFCVSPKLDSLFEKTSLLWAEAKTGNYDIVTMFVQLILTIGKARTFDKILPPAFLGVFDFQKIAFVPYMSIQDIFYLNDFNWNVTPSNHETKEFLLIKSRLEELLNKNIYKYDFEKDENELKFFIANNIANSNEGAKIKIDKNNFLPIYLRWIKDVKPYINVSNWDELKKNNIIDADFFLADLFVDDKNTQNIEDDFSIRHNLFVVFENQGYKIAKEDLKQMFDATISINKKDIYQQFWKKYKRPPLKQYQDFIIDRRDLLVPQDIRERKGAFFTPRKRVELSQKYLKDYLGENWQDEYYIWDCCAGTGNLLTGLTNKYNIWASTLDQADVNVMQERRENGANLLKSHVFQFDFLNDDFSKLPQGLQDIIADEEKRKKLVIYINPPYAEAGNTRKRTGSGDNKAKSSIGNKTYEKYKNIIGNASKELFALFLTRIYAEIPKCTIANFSKLKNLQSSNFIKFREFFQPKLERLFIVPADTFDNVSGQFPIGFFIWIQQENQAFNGIKSDIYDSESKFLGNKNIYSYNDTKGKINNWLNLFRYTISFPIGYLMGDAPDFQNNRVINIQNEKGTRHGIFIAINESNLIMISIYFAVRKVIPATWLNDRDQFLFPNDGWKEDFEFQNDCLIYTLFSNNIQSKFGTNYWIPFTEAQVDAKEKFESHFMSDFINGKLKSSENNLLENEKNISQPLVFSSQAQEVFEAGRQLWHYYHSQPGANPNASLYDIREYFQGRNEKGKMNSKSNDENYSILISKLREKLKILAKKIEPKVYEYGFLKN